MTNERHGPELAKVNAKDIQEMLMDRHREQEGTYVPVLVTVYDYRATSEKSSGQAPTVAIRGSEGLADSGRGLDMRQDSGGSKQWLTTLMLFGIVEKP